jgi:hypothetical protein
MDEFVDFNENFVLQWIAIAIIGYGLAPARHPSVMTPDSPAALTPRGFPPPWAVIESIRAGVAPDHHAGACRPPSVIVGRSMLSVRPAAFMMISGFAAANPARTMLASSLTVNPCARSISSVHPCGLPARISSARRYSPLRSRLRGSHRHWTPLRLSRAGCSRQFGRASAPTIPQFVDTIRGPNDGTGTSSDAQDRPVVPYPAANVERSHAVWRACCPASLARSVR